MKVLHVENSDLIKCIVKNLVEKSGMEYHAFSHSGEISEFNFQKFDLVITALENIESKGLFSIEESSFLGQLTIPVLVISAQDSLEIRKRLFTYGIVDYIKKDQMFQRRLSVYLETLVSSKRYNLLLENKKICIVDDSAFDLHLMKKILIGHGTKNVHCFKSFEAVNKQGLSCDIFIIDLVLPGDCGEVVISKIREKNPDAIIILVTGSSNYGAVSYLLMYGADDCVFKPYSSQIFLTRIKNQIKTKEALCELRRKNDKLEKMLRYDHLTNIYNRKTILNYLKRLEYIHKEERVEHGIIMVDIDDFKKINDTYGHMKGDEVISRVSQIIQSSIRKGDAVGRYGGEEFLVILPSTEIHQAIEVAERIRRNVENGYFEIEQEKPITVSAGLAIFTSKWTDAVNCADQRLFISKRYGKNRITYLDENEAHNETNLHQLI